MKEQEIIEENKLIAEFMGARIGLSGICHMLDGEKYFCKKMNMKTDKYLRYHYSWDWLMPVIEKISQIKFDDGDYCFPMTFGMINSNTGQFMFRFNRHVLFQADTLIEAAFMAVVDYIKNK